MRRGYARAGLVLAGLVVAVTMTTAEISVITDGPDIWQVMGAAAGSTATLSNPPEGPQGEACQRLDLMVEEARNQWAVIHAALPGLLNEQYKAVKVTFHADLPLGVQGPLVILSEREGADYLYPPFSAPVDRWQTYYLPLDKFALASWSKDEDGKLDLAHVYEVRIGVAGDPREGAGFGTLWLSELTLVKETPQGALSPPRSWLLLADKAGRAQLTMAAEGQGGETVVRLDFDFPTEESSYAFAATMLGADDHVVGTSKLRLTYKTKLPAGIEAVQVVVGEGDDTQYRTELDAAADWKTMEVPLVALRLAPGAQDDDGELDLDQVTGFGIGVTGQAEGQDRSGVIWLQTFEFVP